MQLTSTMFLSVDGVYQGPGGPGEDTDTRTSTTGSGVIIATDRAR